ncbi:MAG TPA: hypothetical protein VFF96_07370 [Pseudoxanthomonas sp.]|nr:hypothetical protein [Pseudoxanthomonas sp.]
MADARAMTDMFSLIVTPRQVECVVGRIDDPSAPETGEVVWNGRRLRLVHEQRESGEDLVWFIYGDIDLSKPETLTRAAQWAESTRRRQRPALH